MIKRYDEKNKEGNMQTASFISGHCVKRHHSFPFTPFDPDLLFLLLFFFVRLHTINVCHLLTDQKNPKTNQNKTKNCGPS